MFKKTIPSAAFACLWLLLASCGYRFGEQDSVQRLQESSISIPYAVNDVDGQLTDELIKAFSSAGFNYRPFHGTLELKVNIINQDNKALGWRFNRNPEGKRNKDLIITEGRRHANAEVTLIDTLNDEVLLGPIIVQAEVDLDFYEPDNLQDVSFINSKGVRQTSISFSLGQLDSIEGAYDDAWTPLSRRLAKKILDLVLYAKY